jgi:hypothetical protein
MYIYLFICKAIDVFNNHCMYIYLFICKAIDVFNNYSIPFPHDIVLVYTDCISSVSSTIIKQKIYLRLSNSSSFNTSMI